MGGLASMSVKRCAVVLVIPAILLSGCMGLAGDGSPNFELFAEADSDHGLIITSFEDGEQSSSTAPVITFDFSNSTNSDEIEEFGVVPGDGREAIVIQSSEGSSIAVEYPLHGLYSVTAFGVDKDGLQANQTLEVRIEQLIDWYENDTGTPGALVFESTPGNGWPIPSHFLLNSTVQNPSIIEFDGREVDVKWDIVNQDGVCQTADEVIDNGETAYWKTIHFGPHSTHEIYLTIEDGQDRVNVHHSLEIRYS